jgi:NAD(P)-dependent dehydrogenase (short-subunit alcohol dehydrogenase family)
VRLGPCQDAEQELRLWLDTIATNLTGAFHVVRAVVLRMIAGDRRGVIILTRSTAGTRPIGGFAGGPLAYTVSKFGLVGIGKRGAEALAVYSIWVNVIHPTGVASGMPRIRRCKV